MLIKYEQLLHKNYKIIDWIIAVLSVFKIKLKEKKINKNWLLQRTLLREGSIHSNAMDLGFRIILQS